MTAVPVLPAVAPALDTAALLRTAVPAHVVLDDPDVLASYAADQSQLTASGRPAAVVVPRTTEQVSAVLRVAHEHGLSVVPRGAGSGLSGGANCPDGAVVLSLHRMDAVVRVDAVDRVAVVQPGVVTADLRAAAKAAGLFYPPDPGSLSWCTVGGNVATNAGGMCCVKYGVTGDFVLALEVVLADGRVIRTGTATVKGVAGYDLTRLFVGSEGTLGVVTEVTVRLLPAPPDPVTLVASFRSTVDAGACVSAVVAAGAVPSLMELLDRTTVQAVDTLTGMGLGTDVGAMLLLQSDAPDAATAVQELVVLCEASGALDVAVTDDPAEGFALLEARRMALPALEALGDWLLDDVCVPRSRSVELLAAVEAVAADVGLTIGVFGHAGDGNFHPTVIFDAQEEASVAAARRAFDLITEAALRLGGTITGEHGVGQLKRDWLAREVGEANLSVQQAIKAALDPAGVLNPGTVLA